MLTQCARRRNGSLTALGILDMRCSLELVTADRIAEDDALCLTLTYRSLYDAMLSQFPDIRLDICRVGPHNLGARDL